MHHGKGRFFRVCRDDVILRDGFMVESGPFIEGQTSIEWIVENHPELIRLLREYGIVCIRCGEPIWGTLEQATHEKGIVDLDRIIETLNRRISRRKENTGP